MLESFILGTIQGIAEWLPVSSEGLIFLVKANFFNFGETIREITELVLWLHLGTFLAALVYFRKEVWVLSRALFKFKSATENNQRILIFLIISTLVSGILGAILLLSLTYLEGFLTLSAKVLTLAIGILLLVTAGLQFRARGGGLKKADGIKGKDGVILGLAQGLAVLPGLSRSGLTVSVLLLRKFKEDTALKLSFLMSMPIVLGGNIILNMDKLSLNLESLVGLLASFIFGYLTIDVLLRVAKKINFAWFVLGFGVLTILAVLM